MRPACPEGARAARVGPRRWRARPKSAQPGAVCGTAHQIGWTIGHPLRYSPTLMFVRSLHPRRLLGSLYGTEPFLDYCTSRGIAFDQVAGGSPDELHARGWDSALTALPGEQQATVELELAKVNELSGRDGTAHLLAVGEGIAVPPEHIPGGPPLALWFLLHHPTLFHEVFLRHEIREVRSWRDATAETGLTPDPATAARSLASALRDTFSLREGSGRFCATDVHRLGNAHCFVAQVADRLRLVEAFTDDGRPAAVRVRPAVPLLFVYRPHDGTVLLKSHLRSQDRIRELFARFGEAALGKPVTYRGTAFDLDRLKTAFHPQPDAPDMEAIRLKTLHLRYPERWGRRRVKLETLSSDAPSAIEELVAAHAGEPGLLDRLQVCHAELEVRLAAGGGRKAHVIRLWPDRSNLGETPLGLRLRACLVRWGIHHAPKP